MKNLCDTCANKCDENMVCAEYKEKGVKMNKHKKRKAEAKRKAVERLSKKIGFNCLNCQREDCHGCPNEITQDQIDDDKLHINLEEKSKKGE